MPEEAVHTLMEAHHNLSEEISHFLFSFAFELEHATSEDIGKLVAEYAGNYWAKKLTSYCPVQSIFEPKVTGNQFHFTPRNKQLVTLEFAT